MEASLLEAYRGCARGGADEVRIALLVARLLDPELDVAATAARLAALGRDAEPDEAPWRLLDRLGFAGNRDHYDALENSSLDWVLETRRGIPITLGVVLIGVARARGRDAAGVNFPGHFLVRVGEVLVDPFVMTPVDEQAFRRRLPEDSQRLPSTLLFPEATPVAVGLRMLNNVKMAFTRQAAWDRMLDVLDAQIALAPEHPALHLEHGDLWRRLGLVAPARTSYRRAVSLAEELAREEAQALLQAAQARLDELGGASDVLH